MRAPTIPAVLYMSLRTGQLVERPSHEGWTPGDVRMWEDEHATFPRLPPGLVSIDALVKDAICAALDGAAAALRDSADNMSSLHEGASKSLLHEAGGLVEDLADDCFKDFKKRGGF